MNTLLNVIQKNSATISSKLAQLRVIASSVSSSEMDPTITARLREENALLKQQIVEATEKLQQLELQREKLLPSAKNAYPLPTPKVLSTSQVSSTVTETVEKTEIAKDDITNATNKAPVAKKQKAPAKPKAPKEPAKPEIIDVSRLDMRVGRIVEVSRHPDAEKLYMEKIDMGEAAPRTVLSGLVDYLPIEEMQNRLVIVMCNLKPAKMRGIVSEGMVMCASDKESNKVLPVVPPEGAQPGDRVQFEKYPGQPDEQLNPKKKIWEQVSPDLITDANGVATYKGDPFVVLGKGQVTAPGMPNIAIR